MLLEIYINNFVLIDEIRMQFKPGLNVLTGETGAGKSIIIDALGLILGERIKNETVRDSSRRAIAEAVFDVTANIEARAFLEQQGLLDEGESVLVLSREIVPGGRNLARINGRVVPASSLKNISTTLLDMHLQHEHLSILRPEMYLDYVDSFTPESVSLGEDIKTIYEKLHGLRAELQLLQADRQHALQKRDFLDYQIQEIEKAALQPGEEEELQALKVRIINAQKLMEGSSEILALLYSKSHGDSAYDLVAQALEQAERLKNDHFFDALGRNLEEVYYTLQEMSAALSSYLTGLDFEPGLIDQVEDRLYEINRLKNKYGSGEEEVLAFLEQARQERENLEQSQEKESLLQKEIETLNEHYLLKAHQLSACRKKGAGRLQDRVKNELVELNMPRLEFSVTIESGEKQTAAGVDRAEFLFSPNPGEPLRPLERIASGGEISRFILALKTALTDAYHVPTLIFDEIDVGVGGSSLAAMAGKLNQLSRSHQVILVTHAPQVAGYADNHFQILKKVEEGRTITQIEQLEKEERIQEIARMLGGEKFSSITLEHAREIYNKAHSSQ